MKVDDSYKGPQMKSTSSHASRKKQTVTVVNGSYAITLEFVEDMMKEFKEQRVIHKRFAFEILLQASHFLSCLR